MTVEREGGHGKGTLRADAERRVVDDREYVDQYTHTQ